MQDKKGNETNKQILLIHLIQIWYFPKQSDLKRKFQIILVAN